MTKRPPFTKIGESEKWSGGNRVSEATKLERGNDNKKGISVHMGSRSKFGRTTFSRTIWIDEDLDLPSWLGWFIKTIKKMYFDLFGKKLETVDDEKEFYKTKVDELARKLANAQNSLDEAEKRDTENKKTYELAKQLTDKVATMQSVADDFKKQVEKSSKENVGLEEELKTKIKENPWLLGLECSVDAKNQDVDIQTQIDLHIKTKYEQDRIFELKSPNLHPFRRKNNDDKRRFEISPDLSDALSEIILYLERTDVYADKKSEGVYGITKPSGYILIGYNLTGEEQKFLKFLNFHLLPHVQICTYNEIIANIQRELAIIQEVTKSE